MCVLWEGWERGVVLYCVEVEDMHPSVVICCCEPLAIEAYGHACYCSWQGHCSVGRLGIIDHNGFCVKLLGILLQFGQIRRCITSKKLNLDKVLSK